MDDSGYNLLDKMYQEECAKNAALRESLREMIKHAERLEARLIATRTPTRALKKDIAKAKALVGDK